MDTTNQLVINGETYSQVMNRLLKEDKRGLLKQLFDFTIEFIEVAPILIKDMIKECKPLIDLIILIWNLMKKYK